MVKANISHLLFRKDAFSPHRKQTRENVLSDPVDEVAGVAEQPTMVEEEGEGYDIELGGEDEGAAEVEGVTDYPDEGEGRPTARPAATAGGDGGEEVELGDEAIQEAIRFAGSEKQRRLEEIRPTLEGVPVVIETHGGGEEKTVIMKPIAKFPVIKRPDDTLTSQSKTEIVKQIMVYRGLLKSIVDVPAVDPASSMADLVVAYQAVRQHDGVLPKDAMLRILAKNISADVEWSRANDPDAIHRLIYAITRDPKPLPSLVIQHDVYRKAEQILGKPLNGILFAKFRNNFARYREIALVLETIKLGLKSNETYKLLRRLLIRHLTLALITLGDVRMSDIDAKRVELLAAQQNYVKYLHVIIGWDVLEIQAPTTNRIIELVIQSPQDSELKEVLLGSLARLRLKHYQLKPRDEVRIASEVEEFYLSEQRRLADRLDRAMGTQDEAEVRSLAQRAGFELGETITEDAVEEIVEALRNPVSVPAGLAVFREFISQYQALVREYEHIRTAEAELGELGLDLQTKMADPVVNLRAVELVDALIEKYGADYPFRACLYAVIFNHAAGTNRHIRYLKTKFLSGEFPAEVMAGMPMNETAVPELLTLDSPMKIAEAVQTIGVAARELESRIKNLVLRIMIEKTPGVGELIMIGVPLRGVKSVVKACTKAFDGTLEDLVIIPSGKHEGKFLCYDRVSLARKISRGDNNPETGEPFEEAVRIAVERANSDRDSPRALRSSAKKHRKLGTQRRPFPEFAGSVFATKTGRGEMEGVLRMERYRKSKNAPVASADAPIPEPPPAPPYERLPTPRMDTPWGGVGWRAEVPAPSGFVPATSGFVPAGFVPATSESFVPADFVPATTEEFEGTVSAKRLHRKYMSRFPEGTEGIMEYQEFRKLPKTLQKFAAVGHFEKWYTLPTELHETALKLGNPTNRPRPPMYRSDVATTVASPRVAQRPYEAPWGAGGWGVAEPAEPAAPAPTEGTEEPRQLYRRYKSRLPEGTEGMMGYREFRKLPGVLQEFAAAGDFDKWYTLPDELHETAMRIADPTSRSRSPMYRAPSPM